MYGTGCIQAELSATLIIVSASREDCLLAEYSSSMGRIPPVHIKWLAEQKKINHIWPALVTLKKSLFWFGTTVLVLNQLIGSQLHEH